MRSGWVSATAACLLTVLAVVQFTSMRTENSTADECIHLSAGYIYLRQRAFNINAEHPPLAKLLCALPLLALNPNIPSDFQRFETEEGELGRTFLYRNRVPADQMLTLGRCVSIGFTLLLGLAIFLYARGRFGSIAALIALTMFCFEPTVVAHGHYVTTDMLAALTFFLSCVTWERYLERPEWHRLVAAGVCLGLGLLAKFSLLLLPLVLAAMLAARWRTRSARDLARAAAGMAGIAAAVVLFAYAGETGYLYQDKFVEPYFQKSAAELRADPEVPATLIPVLDRSGRLGQSAYWVASHVPIPAYSFWKGVYRLYGHEYFGHDAYLLGSFSKNGWWYYFPVAFLVKTPVSLLAMVLVTVALIVWKRPPLPWLSVGAPPLIYLAASLAGNIDIGVRHLLPAYPFLFIICGAVLAAPAGRWITTVLLTGLIVESASAYPRYLSYFNAAVGGPSNGPKYLLDSNIDWGQDLLNLKRYMDRQHIDSVCLRYFGSGMPGYYGITAQPLTYPPAPECRVVAASVNELYFRDSKIKGLLNVTPTALAGDSIYVWKLPAKQ